MQNKVIEDQVYDRYSASSPADYEFLYLFVLHCILETVSHAKPFFSWTYQ